MVTCPVCESDKDFERIGVHWARACTFPHPSPAEQSLFVGMWLAGASTEWTHTHPLLRKRSHRVEPLRWVAAEAGVWTSSLTEYRGVTTNDFVLSDGEEQRHRRDWRWTSVSCPWLEHLVDADVANLGDQFTPLAARILLSFKGSQTATILRISHPEAEALRELVQDHGFDVSVTQRDGRSNAVQFGVDAARAFVEWIGNPIPGFEDKFDVESIRATGEVPPWQDREALADLCDRGLTAAEIQAELDCSAQVLYKWLDRFDLEPGKKYPELHNPAWLRTKYWDDGLSQSAIDEEIGCSKQAVSKHTRRLDIDTRNPGGRT